MSEPQSNQPVFSIEKVYVKDLSVEIPNAPQVFLEREAPVVDIQLHHNSTSVEDGVYETVLTVTVTKPGSFGMVKTFTVRANQRPSIAERCLAPDSRARASCQS